MKYVKFFEELSKNDVPLVGGKNANLGEMISFGIPVPPGFAVTALAYKEFIERTGIKEKIFELLKGIDVNVYETLERTSRQIRNLIIEGKIPDDMAGEIVRAYSELSSRVGERDIRVAVRSSATAEDLPSASFAGEQATYLNVKGDKALIRSVKECWASLFTARAIFYRETKGFSHFKVLISVGVQKMVESKASGIMFTVDPVTGDDVIVIESSWGLGEYVVGGKVTPDRFVVDKKTLEILERDIKEKDVGLFYDPKTGTNVEVRIEESRAKSPSLTDEEIKELARLGIKIENHYGKPMDMEFAVEDRVYIVQARPVTAIGKRKATKVSGKEILVKGLPASPGVARGKVHVLFDPVKEGPLFKKGEILVTKMTDPDWVPLMKKAAAIVTDEGGMTAHAAIVSRELGIPCIVGTGNATKVLKTGMEVTVNATVGVVYRGAVEEEREKPVAVVHSSGYIPTGTKIYMNLGQPDMIEKYKDLPIDGIGLMRIEFIISEWIGKHPLYMIKQGDEKTFIDRLSDGISKVAGAVFPKPVVVRFSDFKTNEYRELYGGEEFEPEERNPMIGWRGVSRYVSKTYEPAFRLECRAVRKCREQGLKNVWVMFPFVRTIWELERAIKIMKEEGLERGRDFKVLAMAEVPSIVFLAEEFSEFVDGFSIGSNDLTQLVLGVSRDSQILSDLGYFDEREEAVKRAISMLIEKAHSKGKTVSICGQAPSVYPEFSRFLVECGIDSISVNPDAVIRTRQIVASEERKLMLDALRRGKV